MRALTLTQPWCGLVAAGVKLRENRPRHLIKREDFGKPFALHASREVDREVYQRIYEIAPELHHELAVDRERARWHQLSRITSAVIAIATIDSVLDPLAHGIQLYDPGAFGAEPPDQRRWCFGSIVYVLRDVQAIATPVPCKGALGFWTLPPDVERAVAAQIGAAS